MADSLVLKGVKDVIKHKGSEMLLVQPKRGGNTHRIKRWWAPNAVNTVYQGCSLFKVSVGIGVCYLAVNTSEMSTIRIDHKGEFIFGFYSINGVDRAALVNQDMDLIEHYMFPKISGGKIVTVVPPNGAPRPNTLPATSISNVVVTGELAPNVGGAYEYTVDVTGTAGSLTYDWSVTKGQVDDVVGNVALIQWNEAGEGNVSCTVGSDDPNFDGVNGVGSLTVNIAVLFSSLVANATFTYSVTVADGNYELNGVANAGIAGSVGDSFHFDLSDASLAGHPLKIYTDETKTTEVTVGIQRDGDDLVFTPPIAGTFSYQCGNHAGMGGNITVS